MRCPTLATSAVVACALVCPPAAHAARFNLVTAAVTTDHSVVPSSGAFLTQFAQPGLENFFVPNDLIVTDGPIDWRDSLDEIMTSSWVAMDRLGPKGADGAAAYGTGWKGTKPLLSGGSVHLPEATFRFRDSPDGFLANGQGGDIDGDGLSIGLFGGDLGAQWTAGTPQGLLSLPTRINGVTRHSMFVGHFALSDPDAVLVGEDLLVGFDPTSPGPEAGRQYRVPLDGTRGADRITGDTVPFRLEYERVTFTNSLGTFTALDMYLVPAPAAAAPLLLGVGLPRRRRHA